MQFNIRHPDRAYEAILDEVRASFRFTDIQSPESTSSDDVHDPEFGLIEMFGGLSVAPKRLLESTPYTDDDLREFARRMIVAFDFIFREGFDLVIYPLRGAEPFKMALDHIAEIKSEAMPPSLLVPVGVHYDADWLPNVVKGDLATENRGPLAEYSLKRYEKRAILQTCLERFVATSPPPNKILLLDEVYNGGTLLNHAEALRPYSEYLGASLDLCGMESAIKSQGRFSKVDDRYLPTNKSQRYRSRAQAERFFAVPLVPNFFLDRQVFLPLVVRSDFDRYEFAYCSSQLKLQAMLNAVGAELHEVS